MGIDTIICKVSKKNRNGCLDYKTAVISLHLVKDFLALADSVVRTNLCAAAAADAGIGIDVIDIALRDCVYRAN